MIAPIRCDNNILPPLKPTRSGRVPASLVNWKYIVRLFLRRTACSPHRNSQWNGVSSLGFEVTLVATCRRLLGQNCRQICRLTKLEQQQKTHSCPRDLRLAAIMGSQFGAPHETLRTSQYYRTRRGLRNALNWSPIMLKDATHREINIIFLLN